MKAWLGKFIDALVHIMGAPNRALKRFQKRRAMRPVKVSNRMGTRIVLVNDEGTPMMELVLAKVFYSSEPGSRHAVFDDPLRYMQMDQFR